MIILLVGKYPKNLSKKIKKKVRTLTLKLFTFVPMLCLTTLISFWLRAISAIGGLPFYSNPDPKDMGMELHFDLIVVSIFLIPISVIVIALNIKKIGKPHLILFFIPLCILLFMLLVDPFDIIDWLLD